uniref:Uncharacterized protein n=1 Tax=Arundo donax TaxID=35708 RepID=A0A0A9F6F8_ARUDO
MPLASLRLRVPTVYLHCLFHNPVGLQVQLINLLSLTALTENLQTSNLLILIQLLHLYNYKFWTVGNLVM